MIEAAREVTWTACLAVCLTLNVFALDVLRNVGATSSVISARGAYTQLAIYFPIALLVAMFLGWRKRNKTAARSGQ